ncbi:MAG TPA: cytochrome c-type biogenesis protein [Anaerolineales bacterium]
MKRSGIFLAVSIGMAALVFFIYVVPARAQGPTPAANIDDEVNRIAKNLYCPVCPNTPLDVCSTQACIGWRAQIKDMLVQGKNEQQIRDYFVEKFGQQVLGAPPAQGFNWLAYILPFVGIILGATVAWFTVRQWIVHKSGSAEAAAPPENPAIPKEYADRIEKELKEY